MSGINSINTVLLDVMCLNKIYYLACVPEKSVKGICYYEHFDYKMVTNKCASDSNFKVFLQPYLLKKTS